MNAPQRARLADELSRRLAAAIRGAQLYAPGHPLVTRSATALVDTLTLVHQSAPSVAIGIVGEELVVGEVPVPRAAETMGELMRRLQQLGIERIVIDRGVHEAEIEQLVRRRRTRRRQRRRRLPSRALPHIRVGRLEIEEQVDGINRRHRDVPQALRRCREGGGDLWESASVEGAPDADAARGMVDSLAQAVAQNRTALLSLTALKNYDNYTFTHMVNVSILTMGQARGVGIDGALLREFGLAALMHDIGKVQTPNEILNKPEQAHRRGIHDSEAAHRRRRGDPAQDARDADARADRGLRAPPASRRHRLPGADASAAEPGHDAVPASPTCTMRCDRSACITPAFPTDRILAVLQRTTASSSIRTWSGASSSWSASTRREIWCASTAAKSPSCSRPTRLIRIVRGFASCSMRTGSRFDDPQDVNLWEGEESQTRSIQAPVDPCRLRNRSVDSPMNRRLIHVQSFVFGLLHTRRWPARRANLGSS